MNDFEKFLFGDQDTRKNLQNQITTIQNQLANMGMNDPNRQALVARLGNMKAQLEAEMRKQGATDASGRLVSAKDVQDQYLNKDYLNLLKEQSAQTSAGALATGLKAAKQASLSGTEGAGDIRSVMAKVENITRNANADLAGQVANQQELAYGKAGQDLSRKQQYATQLTEADRSAIIDQLNQQLADMGFAQNQIASLSAQLNSMPDGFLQQLISGGAKLLGEWIGSIKDNAETAAKVMGGM